MNNVCLVEKVVKTTLGNDIYIRSSNLRAKKHFDDPISYGDFIISQINEHNIYNKYLNGKDLVILDIGANVGLFSLHCVDCAKIVYSFEPTPSHFSLLKEFTLPYKNIEPVNVAISDCDGEIDLYICEFNTTMNSLKNKYGTKVTVSGRSIISFLKEKNITKVDFIKCDIEGSEMIALKPDCIKPLFDIVDKWFIKVHATDLSREHNINILTYIFESIGYSYEKIGDDTLFFFKK
jgi:FkbM family methyltransferase